MTRPDSHRVAAPNGVCEANWGVCPEHGNTLVTSGGRCWCSFEGCGRGWDEDRLGRHCDAPVAFLVRVGALELLLCAGHAIAARAELRGVTVQPIATGEEERS